MLINISFYSLFNFSCGLSPLNKSTSPKHGFPPRHSGACCDQLFKVFENLCEIGFPLIINNPSAFWCWLTSYCGATHRRWSYALIIVFEKNLGLDLMAFTSFLGKRLTSYCGVTHHWLLEPPDRFLIIICCRTCRTCSHRRLPPCGFLILNVLVSLEN